MHFTGTIANSISIILGGLLGISFGKFFKKDLQNALTIVCGLTTIFMGISGALSKMILVENGILISGKSLLLVISFAIGTIVGETIGIEDYFEKFGEWLKKKTGSANDNRFVNAFVSASLIVSVGAMAIVGSIQDGMLGDPSTLYVKSVLDFIVITVLTSSLGKGAIFSVISVFIFQGSLTLLSTLIAPIFTELAISYISLVGSVLIFCVGINLVFNTKIKISNMLPSIIVAVILSYIPYNF